MPHLNRLAPAFVQSVFARILLLLMAVSAALPAQAATSLRWTPSALSAALALSEQKTVQLAITAVKPLKNLALEVSPSLAPYVQATPTTVDSIPKNGTVEVQLTVTAPAAADPNTEISGTVQVSTGKNSRLLDDPLPVALTFNAQNRIPTADAGPDQTVFVNDTVQLDGSASSDLDGDPLTYDWSFFNVPSGSTAALSDPTLVNPTFVVDRPGDYTLELVVDDGLAQSTPDTVVVSTQNSAPVANAGPDQTVLVGDLVTLDGSGSSDVDGDFLSYAWTLLQQPLGSAATLTNPLTVAPSFTVDQPGNYLTQLLVNDGLLDSAPDTVAISTENSKPIADAGPDQSGYVGDTITLDGSASSDVDGDPLTYDWSLITLPEGSTASLTTPTAVQSSFVPDLAGAYVGQLIVNDGALDSDPDSALVTIEIAPGENQPPQITSTPVTAAVEGQPYSYDVDATDPDVGDSLTYTLNTKPDGMTIDSASGLIQWTPTLVQLGDHSVQVQVTDLGGLFDTQDFTVTVSEAPPANESPQVEAGADQTITLPTSNVALNATVTDDGLPDPPAGLLLTWSQDGGADVVFGDPHAEDTTASFPGAGSYVLRLTADDGDQSAFDTVTITVEQETPPVLPPDPDSVAPPVDPSVSTRVGSSTEFLYTGPNPIQTGVAPGTIEERRAAVIRGKVFNRAGSPLPGVTVTILNHPELGQTLSRADGAFDLAVNGGGIITLDYQKPGYLPAQRQVNAPWQDYVYAPDVRLVTLDPEVTPVDLTNTTSIQVARGSTSSDDDGARRATLLFTPGTTAQMVLPDGSTQPLDSLSIRATEYTIGSGGPDAMPAGLPPTSGYTYALEISADQALAAGASSVVLNQPIPFYVENFLGFPVGTVVPAGYYDRDKGQWIAAPNGRVIKVLSLTGGLADLDTDGDTIPDTPEILAALGIDAAEQAKLAELYSAGQSLWRVPMDHFTPWDYNWPYGPPPDAKGPDDAKIDPGKPKLNDQPSCQTGSVIGCETQTLGEAVPITGTPFSLHYQSERSAGYAVGRTLEIRLTGANIPSTLTSVQLTIEVAGQRFTEAYQAQPNTGVTWTWDGLDAYGRPVVGVHVASIDIAYLYGTVYYATADQWEKSFAIPSGVPTTIGGRRSANISLERHDSVSLHASRLESESVGGWSLSHHHRWDPTGRVLIRGDGVEHPSYPFGPVITTVAGGGSVPSYTDEGLAEGLPATEVLFPPSINDVAVGPDGSLYIATDYAPYGVSRVDPDGIFSIVAGGISCYYPDIPDGARASDVCTGPVLGIDVGPDSSLYLATDYGMVLRVDPQGFITNLARDLYIRGPQGTNGGGIAVGADGSVYVAESYQNRVVRVGPDGSVTTAAGWGSRWWAEGDGGPATDAALSDPQDVAVGPDGSLYIGSFYGRDNIRRVTPDGIITSAVGHWSGGPAGDGGPATEANLEWPSGLATSADGTLYLIDDASVRRVGPDGIITTVAGTRGLYGFSGDGGTAKAARLGRFPGGIAVGPDGSLYIADTDNGRVRRVHGAGGNQLLIPSQDGTELYEFNLLNRHIRTLDALTGGTLFSFGHDPAGRLSSVTDGDGNLTTIERSAAGNPTAIVGPYGQRTGITLDADGHIASLTNPAGETHAMTYTPEGLLTRFENPRGLASTMTYDAQGRLVQDSDPATGFKALSRVDGGLYQRFEVTTALGRVTTYDVSSIPTGYLSGIPAGGQLRSVKGPDGTVSVTEILNDGTVTNKRADGMITQPVKGPDPRWGMVAPLTQSETVTTPGGLSRLRTQTRAVTLADSGDLLSLVTQTDEITVNGRTTVAVYDGATRTLTSTSPAGRVTTAVLDGQGRLVRTEQAGLSPVLFGYDTQGRLQTLTHGEGLDARTASFAYGGDGWLASSTDALAQSTDFEHDLAGRNTRQVYPDGNDVLFGYDPNSNLTSLSPPDRPAHGFDYTPVDLMADYTPPAVTGGGATGYQYDLDKQLSQVTRPDGGVLSYGYNSGGRLSSLTVPGGSYSYAYDGTTGQLIQITTPDGGTLGYSYDGALLTELTWGGAVSGGVGFAYDNDFRLTEVKVNGADPIAYAYDLDSLLVQAGDLALTRDPANGLLTAAALGSVTDSLAYNGFGETSQHTGDFSGTPLLEIAYTRDVLGRIAQKVETLGGVTTTYDYAYDNLGQLIEVKHDGNLAAAYAYDANGNRLSKTGPGISEAGTYDAQDRLLTYAGATYAYTANGERLTKTEGSDTTSYVYDVLGNLRQDTLPDGTQIEYLIDGRNRRIGKKVNSTLVQGFLYQDQLKPIAELDGVGNVVSRFVYATGVNAPDYLVKGGVTYRILKDHLGSPRLIVDTTSGAIAQRLDYDEFGKVILDTNPGFQPFGFAGGLYEPATGLVRFGARDYDPTTGRWTAKDPIRFAGDGPNLYFYSKNDPVNRGDPTGHFANSGTIFSTPCGLIGGAIGAAGGAIMVGVATGVLTVNPVIGVVTAVGGLVVGYDPFDLCGGAKNENDVMQDIEQDMQKINDIEKQNQRQLDELLEESKKRNRRSQGPQKKSCDE